MCIIFKSQSRLKSVFKLHHTQYRARTLGVYLIYRGKKLQSLGHWFFPLKVDRIPILGEKLKHFFPAKVEEQNFVLGSRAHFLFRPSQEFNNFCADNGVQQQNVRKVHCYDIHY